MRFLLLFATIYSIIVFNSDWGTDSQQHDSQKILNYHHPSSFTNNSINHYSIIHFFQYAAISILKFLNIWHIITISILWEIFELFTHFEWARESWLNKFFDIIFNISGFYFGRFFLKKVI